MLLKIQDSDKMSEAGNRSLKSEGIIYSVNPDSVRSGPPRELSACLVSMDRPERPDLPSHLKYYDRNDYVETLPGRSQTTRTTETTSVAWIELSSIRTIGMIV